MSENTTQPNAVPSPPFGDDSVGYDPTTGTFHARFDTDKDQLTIVIVEAVAIVTGRDPTTLPPLYERVDPEALATLLASTDQRRLEVTVTYADCDVTVSSHGTVVVEPLAE